MKRFLLFALAATMFAACATDQTQDIAVGIEAPETLTVSFEEDSRIQLQDGKTVWTKGDLVSVFYRSNANQKWQFQGQTGERTGNLKWLDAGSATREMDRVVVVYPYNENYYINPSTYNVQASMPAVQTYLEDSYGLNGNIMISRSEYNNISLKSVCGWLKLQLTGNGEKVQNIKLHGNNGEQVAGELYINSADATAILSSDVGGADDGELGGAGGNLTFVDTILTEVTLDCGEGVVLSAEPAAFYIALPPQTFENGVTVEIECLHCKTAIKSTDNTITIQRNVIQPMAAFEFDGERIQQNNEIWYTANSLVEPDEPDVFGANIVSNIWNKTTGKGIITFDGEVRKIGHSAFSYCNLSSITIPNRVTSIETSAFQGCNNLTSITIPDSVTSVGTSVFAFCDRLKSFYGKFASEDNRCLIANGSLKAFAPAELSEYIIPSNVTHIDNSAFRGCDKLTNVTIPNSVTGIGEGSFNNCNNLAAFYGKFVSEDNRCLIVSGSLKAFAPAGLTEYEISKNITSIVRCAFYGCSNLTSITIANTVTRIGNLAFAMCNRLKTVYCEATTPPTGGEYMFSHYYTNDHSPIGCTIYVPAEAVNAYKSAGYWSNYADYIVGYDFTDGTDEINGLDDSTLDTNKYLEYVANQSIKFQLTSSRDYNVWETYFTNDDYSAVEVAEYKFQLPSVCDEWTPISDDYIEIYNHRISVHSYTYYDEDDERRRKYVTCDLSTAGISPTDVITLRVDSINGVVTINNVEFYGTVSTAMYKYLFSSYYSEWDEGQYRSYSGITDGTKLYYAKGWDTDGNLIYMGHAAKQVNPDTNNVEACWKSQNYNNGTITEKATFANNNYVTTYIPLGMGNL